MTDQQRELRELFEVIVAHDVAGVVRRLKSAPSLAHLATEAGATRQDPKSYFFEAIAHYAYAGDTALHLAAAAHDADIARKLLSAGAAVRARNRRGAEPLHYAADGAPGSPQWDPRGQAAVIARLVEAGADPNIGDDSGVAPLHRAVRTRCAAAVKALLSAGAEPRLRNKAGSTPLHLAVQTTGRGGSGTELARLAQSQIIELLLESGASASDENGAGKSVRECAGKNWAELFDE
ncbi:MAG: ankyrin repeat domain-containing protein [Polyangiaceae bacterium]